MSVAWEQNYYERAELEEGKWWLKNVARAMWVFSLCWRNTHEGFATIEIVKKKKKKEKWTNKQNKLVSFIIFLLWTWAFGAHWSCFLVDQSCQTLCSSMDCSLISQERILEWVAIFSSRGIFLTQGLNPYLLCVSCTAGGFCTTSHLESPIQCTEDIYITGYWNFLKEMYVTCLWNPCSGSVLFYTLLQGCTSFYGCVLSPHQWDS